MTDNIIEKAARALWEFDLEGPDTLAQRQEAHRAALNPRERGLRDADFITERILRRILGGQEGDDA